MITPYQISKRLNLHFTTVYSWISGKYLPSSKNLQKLYMLTSIPAQAWLSPESFFNPLIPFRYQGKYPPSLSHLQGEALEFAKKILEAFPEKPPTREEFKKFKRKFINGGKNGKAARS